MLNHYLLLAVKVLLRRKFFTFISLFGISFTLLVLTVVAALFDHSFGPGAAGDAAGAHALCRAGRDVRAAQPRGRAAAASSCSTSTRATCRASSGCRSSNTTGRCTRTSTAGRSPRSLKRTDDEFWRILDFTFLEGGPVRNRRRRRGAVRRGHQRQRRASGSSAGGRRSGRRSKPTASGSASSASSRTSPSCAPCRSRTSGCPTRPRRPTPTSARSWAAGTPWRSRKTRRRWPPSARSSTRGCSASSCPIRRSFRRSSPRSRPSSRAFARLMPTGDRKDPESQVWKLVGLLAALGLLFVLIPDRQPRQHQHQPHHGAGLGDRRAQGVRRAGAHAGRAVPRREHPADAGRRRSSGSSLSVLVLRADQPERPLPATRTSRSTRACSPTAWRWPCCSA